MKITIHEVDYILEPCERGGWEVTATDDGLPANTGMVAVVDGWDGETSLTVFFNSNQSGMQEIVVMENTIDGVLTWHRISTVGWDTEAEMDLKIQFANLMNLLMADPMDKEQDITCFPGFPQVTKNRLKAVQRMNKDLKDHREGRVEKAGVQRRQNFTLRHGG